MAVEGIPIQPLSVTVFNISLPERLYPSRAIPNFSNSDEFDVDKIQGSLF